jgi:regulator of sigma E protease
MIEHRGGRGVVLSLERGKESRTIRIVPKIEEGKNLFGEAEQQGKIGVGPSGTFSTVRYGFSEGLGLAVIKTYRIASINLISLGKMVTGHISPSNLGGPILIAQMSAKAAKSGLSNLLVFMGFVSVTLGVMNLLPIPVLDGGHLLFLAFEGIIRKPPSLRVRELSMQVGFVILLTIMVFAFYNDIMRVFGSIK